MDELYRDQGLSGTGITRARPQCCPRYMISPTSCTPFLPFPFYGVLCLLDNQENGPPANLGQQACPLPAFDAPRIILVASHS